MENGNPYACICIPEPAQVRTQAHDPNRKADIGKEERDIVVDDLLQGLPS